MKKINFISPFKRFVVTVGNLPTAYIESMSYYESLTFLVNFLENNVIPALNNNGEVVEELQAQFVALQNYVDNYFENLDVQEEINNKLDELVSSGELEALISTTLDDKFNTYTITIDNAIASQNERITNVESEISSVVSATPIPVSSTSEMTDTTKAYLNTTDGYWYYYNGEEWTQGGVYQATVVADESVTLPTLAEDVTDDLNYKINDKDNFESYAERFPYDDIGYTYGYNVNRKYGLNTKFVYKNIGNDGAVVDSTNVKYMCIEEFIYLPPDTEIYVNEVGDYKATVYLYDKDKTFIKSITPNTVAAYGSGVSSYLTTANNKASYVRIKFYNNGADCDLDDLNYNYLIYKKLDNPFYIEAKPQIGKNMFDKSKYFFNRVLNTNGELVETSNYRTSYLIPVNHTNSILTERVVISHFDKLLILDSDYNKISFIDSSQDNYEFETPGVGYIAISYADSYANTLQIYYNRIGGPAPTYQAYKRQLPSDIDLSNLAEMQDIETRLAAIEAIINP